MVAHNHLAAATSPSGIAFYHSTVHMRWYYEIMFLNDEDFAKTIEGLQTADPVQLAEFWDRFGPMLMCLAEKNLSPGVKRRLGPEDIAQSACRSFLRRARDRQYQLDDSDSLWRLLCVITLTKVREKTRFHFRQKRGVQFEVVLDEKASIACREAAEIDPAQLAEFNDFLSAVLESLDEEEQSMLELRLQHYTQEEIAERLGCSERTVRRILKRVQRNFEKIIAS